MASPAAASQLRRANAYNFVSQSGNTKITYYPIARGPIVSGHPPGPSLEYTGPEGEFHFDSTQFNQQEIPSGHLLSVPLKHQSAVGSLAFSLFLPPVNVGDSGFEKFTTCGVRTNRLGSMEEPGPQVAYETESFTGEARIEFLPR